MGEYHRLSSEVVPEHYDLYIEPDLVNCTFKGKVEINLKLKEEREEIVVNAHEFTDLSVVHLIKLGKNNSKNDGVTTAVAVPPQQANMFDFGGGVKADDKAEADNFKRKRDETSEETSVYVSKKSKPCPGRFRGKSSGSEDEESESEYKESDSGSSECGSDDEDHVTKSADDHVTRTADAGIRSQLFAAKSTAAATDDKSGSDNDDKPKEKETEKKDDVGNDNVKAGSSGSLLLLRSEWAGGEGESSEEEEDYAASRFVDDEDNQQSEEEENEESENDDYGRSDYEDDDHHSDQDKFEILSSGESEGNDDVCLVKDDDDSDDVMQVDGAYEISSDEEEGEEKQPEKPKQTAAAVNEEALVIDDNDDQQDAVLDLLDVSADNVQNISTDEVPSQDGSVVEMASQDSVVEIEDDKDYERVETVTEEPSTDNIVDDKRDNEESGESETEPENAGKSEDSDAEEEKAPNSEGEKAGKSSDDESETEEEKAPKSDNDDESETEEENAGKSSEADQENPANKSLNLQLEDEEENENDTMEEEPKELDLDESREEQEEDHIENPKDEDNQSGHEQDESMETEQEPEEIPDQMIQIVSVQFVREKQVVIIRPVRVLPPGKYKLCLQFSGSLDDSLRGFYRTKHNVNGESMWGAACHFEATGARKCFPCLDQPEFRSTFDIAVKRPNKQVEVLSNMPPVSQEQGDIVKFERTLAMPTYLICLVIGYYDSIARRSDSGVKLTAYTQIGQALQAEYALNVATGALKFYEDFFGVPYSLPKMDMVAVPDFYIGAMENWGLLTFRETALLFHPANSTLSRRQYVAILVCHEIAHQWFGNLVSVAWWDQIWLKEGFATWISFLAVDHLFPEFDIWSKFLMEAQITALRLDSLDSSHPIQVSVEDPGQIDEIFDAISYDKGASIIHMLYHWIGHEAFKAGLNLYLTENGGSSASTKDLWKSLDRARADMDQDDVFSVAEVMDQWTTQQGYPTLDVKRTPDNQISIQQTSRFEYSWQVPVKLYSGEVVIIGCDEYKDDIGNMPTGLPLINSGQASYCRVNYDWESLLGPGLSYIQTLESRDKAGILMHFFLDFVRTRDGKIEHAVELVRHYAGETDWVVVDALLGVFDSLEALVRDTKSWAGYLHLVYSTLTPILEKVGWSDANLSGNITFTQGAVIDRLGRLGHSDTCGEARLLFSREQRAGQRLNKSIRPAVYRSVAVNGGQSEKQYFMDLYHSAQRNEEKRMLLTVLGSFTNSQIVQELLEWSMSDDVKLQDRVFLISCLAETGLEGRAMAFKFFKDNFETLSKQYTSGSLLKRLVSGVVRNFNTEQDLDNINEFFKLNPVPGAQMTLDQCLEDLRILISAREHYQVPMLEYFNTHMIRTEAEMIRG